MVERLISSAIDYCNADAIVTAAQAQFAELASHHDPEDGICCIPPRQIDFDSDAPEALPRSKWCDYCRKYAKEALDADFAKWRRRSARQRMRRAYKQIVRRRASLAETILVMHRSGTIEKRFSASEIEHKLAGVFSHREIREGLSDLAGRYDETLADKRFRALAKYRYEILI